MKKRLVFAAIVILVVGSLGYYLGLPGEGDNLPVDGINELPVLNVLNTNGANISIREAGGKVVLIFFNPDCDHCQREATQISERKPVFRSHSVYFISIDSMQNIVKFARDYNLMESNFFFCQANGTDVYRAVGPLPSVPAIFIYDNKKLVKRLEGEVKVEEIIKYL